MKLLTTAIVASIALAGAAQASTYEYDFKAAANAGGGIGESAYTSFDTTTFFTGPGLTITAGNEAEEGDAYVYFDNSNAGVGVCNDLLDGATADVATNGSANLCNPGSDDGITTTGEFLTFTAQTAMLIEGIWINSNHDSDPIWDTVWEIAEVIYSDALGSFVDDSLSQDGDIYIDLGGFYLAAGDFFDVQGTRGPNSYISGIAVSNVPLPAAGWLLLGGIGGLAAMKRRRKAA